MLRLFGMMVILAISGRVFFGPSRRPADSDKRTAAGSGNTAVQQAAPLNGKARGKQEQSLWSRLKRDQEKFSEGFSHSTTLPGQASALWRTNSVVRFWMETLSSPDAEKVAKAIEVFELAAELDPRKFGDNKGNLRSDLSFLERQSLGIRVAMDGAWHEMSGLRMNLNSAFEMGDVTVEDREETERLTQTLAYAGDSDDAQVLRGVVPVLEVFVARLRSADPQVASRARKVINLYTYNLFPDATTQWWESALNDSKKPR